MQSADELFKLASERYEAKEYRPAVEAFKKSLCLEKHWHTYHCLGWSLMMMNQYQSAVEEFKQSLCLKAFWNSYRGLGWALIDMKQYQSAVDAFRQSLSLKEHWDSCRGLGWALYRTHQYQSSVDAFRHSLSLKEHWASYQGLGFALRDMNQYQQAMDTIKLSLSLKENWDSYRALGWVLHDMKEYYQAVDAFKKSLSLKDNWNAHQGLGSALHKLGELEQGVKESRIVYRYFSPYIKLDPFPGEKDKVSAKRDLIQNIKEVLSEIQFAFHPSYCSRAEEEENLLTSWKHMIYIHIPKCAGTNFVEPLSELPVYINEYLNSNKNFNQKTQASSLSLAREFRGRSLTTLIS